MIPRWNRKTFSNYCIPRESGDDPTMEPEDLFKLLYSPRERG